jgi:cardiolipin synthase (CMP-forming)
VSDDPLDRIVTVPNALSAFRILLIPVFVGLLLHEGTEEAGILLFTVVLATDWVDGFIARRTNQVTNLGKILDPVADRLAIAAGLIALMVRGAVPVWAGLLVIARDLIVLIAGGFLAARSGVRIEVRWIGKAATMALMIGIPMIAWANFGLWAEGLIRVVGWSLYAVGIVLYYAAAVQYWRDAREALAARSV